jgi:predicted HicB family RNase H-like nuclease
MKQAKAKSAKLNLRLDDSLRQQVAAAAEQYERSVNSEIVYRLRSSFERESSGETRAS